MTETNAAVNARGDRREPLVAIWLLARVVWLEAARRKDLWVVALLMCLYLFAAVAVRLVHGGSQGEAQVVAEAQFILNLGLTIGGWLSVTLATLFAAREIPTEIENRTLYPLLAKPVGRGDVVLGKFLAVATVGVATLLVFAILTLSVSPWLSQYRVGLLAQCLALEALAIVALSALTVCLTIWTPTPVALVLALGLYFGGGTLIGIVRSKAPEALLGVVTWLCGYVPDFSLFGLVTRFTQAGPPLAVGEFVGLAFYGGVLTALFLYVAVWGFERRNL